MATMTGHRRWILLWALSALAPATPALGQSGTPTQQRPAAPASKNIAPGFIGLAATDKLLLMPIDVELFSISAGGVREPRADWTTQALKHMNEAIKAKQQRARVSVIELGAAHADEFDEQAALHAAVAQSISLHQFGGSMWELPTKGGRLDWSFGDAMRPIAEASGARYALFIWVRDSYASAERVAMMVALAVFGIVVPGGAQVGYASLVDLQSGQVVWFNRLVRAQGDLREAGPARESIDALLSGFPAVQ